MTVDVNVSKYLLSDYYWPAFRASIRDGKAKGVMCSCRHQPDIPLLPLRAWGFLRLVLSADSSLAAADNSVNGVPTCLDPLMDAARKAWGFDGCAIPQQRPLCWFDKASKG